MLALPALAVGLALLAKLVRADDGDDPLGREVEVHLAGAGAAAEAEPLRGLLRVRHDRLRLLVRRAGDRVLCGLRARIHGREPRGAVRRLGDLGRGRGLGARRELRRSLLLASSARAGGRHRRTSGRSPTGAPVTAAVACGFSIGLLSRWTSNSVPFSPGALSLLPLCSSLSAIFVRSLSPVRSFGPAVLFAPGVGFSSSWSCDGLRRDLLFFDLVRLVGDEARVRVVLLLRLRVLLHRDALVGLERLLVELLQRVLVLDDDLHLLLGRLDLLRLLRLRRLLRRFGLLFFLRRAAARAAPRARRPSASRPRRRPRCRTTARSPACVRALARRAATMYCRSSLYLRSCFETSSVPPPIMKCAHTAAQIHRTIGISGPRDAMVGCEGSESCAQDAASSERRPDSSS